MPSTEENLQLIEDLFADMDIEFIDISETRKLPCMVLKNLHVTDIKSYKVLLGYVAIFNDIRPEYFVFSETDYGTEYDPDCEYGSVAMWFYKMEDFVDLKLKYG